MPTVEELARQVETLRERLTKLSEASFRISESLDVDTVLREVADSARALTGASGSVITTMDTSGGLEDFVTSGVSPEEYRRVLELPYGQELWAYLRDVPGSLRLRDLAGHLSSLGFPEDATGVRSFLGTPIRHRGEHVGNFYLADKEGGREFTGEDEEVLALFASQAGAAIANARNYRDEQRARADLEALIETTPVGVVVFDARSGQVASMNRESRRILRSLCLPGQSEEELGKVLRVPPGGRPGDGAGPYSPEGGPVGRHDGSRRGDRLGGCGWPQGQHAHQCHAHPLGAGPSGVGGRHDAGPDATGGAGDAPSRVPRHGEP